MNLVIVESPAKARTIQKYLGRGFVVKSSYGHVRDLPKSKLGVDTAKNFKPDYVISPNAKKHIAELKKAARTADTIFLATDEDREGEAIAWHLVEALKLDSEKTKRITFGEITKGAIQQAIKNPRSINQDLVDAQQARRVLDRLVGYELSPLLWQKVRRGLSAGRVQSVAVRLIAEREEEIAKFKPVEYWQLNAQLNKDDSQFTAKLARQDGKTISKFDIKTKKQMDSILQALTKAKYVVKKIQKKERKRTPPPPFTTSTLQQAAVNQLGFSSKRTMIIAQQLYEGVELGSEGPTGLITYMRTDSTNLAATATSTAHQVVSQQFGSKYALASPRVFAKKAKGAQEAHEAVRPTDPARLPDQLTAYLAPEQMKLYRLIWQRMIASQMADAKLNIVSADITANNFTFRASGTTVAFDGFVKVLGARAAFKETILPELQAGESLTLVKLTPDQKFTQPPPRYSEATLVKTLEEEGIGRPSTYAPTIDTILRREYVTKRLEDKRLEPTEIGQLVNKLLTEHFPKIVDVGFTATMERDLDEIASGNKDWQPVIKEFYDPFHTLIKIKEKKLNKKDFTEEKTGEQCPECKGELIIKLGRFGKFKACSNYPDCKHTEPIGEEKKMQEEASDKTCPDCKRPLVIKHGRYGPFFGCSGYPDCKHIEPIEKTTGVQCPKCQKGDIVEKKSRKGRTFYACNQYPDCANAYWSKPTGKVCPDCKSLLVYGAKNTTKCSNKECQYTQPTTD